MQETRPPLTTDRIVEVCRELLVEGGPEAVVVREVARRMSVTAPALYKHVAGRDDLLTLLIAACVNEVADACAAARDGCAPQDHPDQLRAATLAFREWALAHKAEFGLIYGTPIAGYAAPPGGPTTAGSRRIGEIFGGIYAGLLATDRLVLVDPADLPAALAADLETEARAHDVPLPAAALYQFAAGWHRMLGLISVEVAGHLDWAMTDTGPFVLRQLDDLATEVIKTASGAPER
ncbi:MAG: TetR/AcrR family transcriptional regulator [Ornithinimicrobium sp.]|uniref:TetR/AcrR family transcriptional regulator n=1 Tax=Ornithinimicrobium sp. TaxID=1977084 RepID=UPI003D9BAEE2